MPTKLDAFRKIHPEYNDVSDQDLAERLNKKYSPEEFNKLIGSSGTPHPKIQETSASEENQGLKGIGEDILQGATKIPGALASTLVGLPEEIYKSGKQILTHPVRAAENYAAGIGETAIGGFNIPHTFSSYLARKGIPLAKGVSELYPEIPNLGIEEALGLNKSEEGDALLRSMGGFGLLGKGGKALTGAFGGTGGLVSSLSREAGKGGLYAATQEQDPLSGALTAALMSRLTKGIVKGGEGILKTKDIVSGGIGNLGPIAALSRGISPEKLQENLEAARGTNVNLGRVLESPSLIHLFENKLQNIPFSGVRSTLSQVKEQVENKGKELLDSLNPNRHVGDMNQVAHSLLNEAAEKQQEIKSNLYKERDRISEAEGHKLELPNFKKTYEGAKESIDESPILKTDPKFRSLFNKLSGIETEKNIKSNILTKEGKPFIETISPSLTDATLVKNYLYNAAKNQFKSPLASERAVGNVYNRLASSLDEDVENSISKKGSPELQNAHQEAKENYKNNFVPFLDKEIWKYTKGGRDPQAMIREIIKPGAKKDLYRDIHNLQKLLPDEEKGLLGYSYLQGAVDRDGNLNPKMLSSLVKQLGPRQYKELFPSAEMQGKVKNYTNLRNMSEEALNVLFNPKTGARLPEITIGLAQLATLGGAGGLHGALLAAAPSIVGNLAQRKLTSPEFREKIVRKVSEKQAEMKRKGKLDYTAEEGKLLKRKIYANLINKGLNTATIPSSIKNLQGNA